jgi:hypothetical protein
MSSDTTALLGASASLWVSLEMVRQLGQPYLNVCPGGTTTDHIVYVKSVGSWTAGHDQATLAAVREHTS